MLLYYWKIFSVITYRRKSELFGQSSLSSSTFPLKQNLHSNQSSLLKFHCSLQSHSVQAVPSAAPSPVLPGALLYSCPFRWKSCPSHNQLKVFTPPSESSYHQLLWIFLKILKIGTCTFVFSIVWVLSLSVILYASWR